MLVVAIGIPLQSYLQSLILVIMFGVEIQYEAIKQPIRFPMVLRLQLVTIITLTLSLMASLFQADYQSTASSKGLRAVDVSNHGKCRIVLSVHHVHCAWVQD